MIINGWQRGNFGFKMIIFQERTGASSKTTNYTFLTEKSYDQDCTLPAYRCRNVYCMSKTRTILFFLCSQVGVLQKLQQPAKIAIYSTWAHWLLRENVYEFFGPSWQGEQFSPASSNFWENPANHFIL